jgi:hypothetical protein
MEVLHQIPTSVCWLTTVQSLPECEPYCCASLHQIFEYLVSECMQHQPHICTSPQRHTHGILFCRLWM